MSRRRFPAGSCPSLFKAWKGARASGRTRTCPLRPLLLPLPCCDSRDVLFWLPQFFHEETGDSGMCCEAGQALVVQLLYRGHSPWLLVPLEPRGFQCLNPKKGRQSWETSRKPCWVLFISLQVLKGFSSWSQTCHKM